MSNKKLCVLVVKSLHRRARSTHRFSVDLSHNFESPGSLSSSFNLSVQSRAFRSCTDHFRENFRVSARKFCSGLEIKCWNCGAVAAASSPVPFLACASCKSIQPVDASVNYFQIFGLENGYEIRDANLEGKYKDWQKKLHPDLVHTKSEKERAYAAEQSGRVTDAYRTLNKPLLRALYLLQLEGIHVDEEKTVSDPDLLAEIMDIREAVEEANGSQALKEIQSQIQRKLESWSDCFGKAFKNREFDDAVKFTQRMTYYERAIEEIIKKL